MEIRWSQLGNPTEPGIYRVAGLGDVMVDGGQIAEAAALGGDPWVEVLETDTYGSSVKSYILGFFRPA